MTVLPSPATAAAAGGVPARPATVPPDGSPSRAQPGGLFALAQDLRIQLFAIVLALGLLHHEAQFLVQQLRVGPLGEYMERWGAVRPTLGWSSEVGLAIHLAVIAISVLILALPRRRALLCALPVPFGLSLLASPDRVSSHSSVIVAALVLVVTFAIAEVAGRGGRRAHADTDAAATDWYDWTLVGLRWLLAWTYAFAAFHKLNPAFFSPAESQAVGFVLPLVEWLPVSRDALVAVVGPAAMFGAVAIEACLPFLLLGRRTRLFGCLLGLLFHLPMMAQGLMDFPLVVLAFYPLFLSVDEARAIVDRLRRPSAAQLACATVVGAGGAAAIWTSRRVNRIYADVTVPEPLLTPAHVALVYLTMLLAAYTFAAVAAVLLDRRTHRHTAKATADSGASRR